LSERAALTVATRQRSLDSHESQGLAALSSSVTEARPGCAGEHAARRNRKPFMATLCRLWSVVFQVRQGGTRSNANAPLLGFPTR